MNYTHEARWPGGNTIRKNRSGWTTCTRESKRKGREGRWIPRWNILGIEIR